MKINIKNTLWTIAVIISIIASVLTILHYSRLVPLSVGIGGNLVTTISLVLEDDISSEYSFSYISDEQSHYGCDKESEKEFTLNIPCSPFSTSRLPKLSDNLQLDQWFDVSEIELSGYGVTINPCSGTSYSGAVVFDNKTATCKITPMSIINGEKKACVDCIITGKVHIEDNGVPSSGYIWGFASGSMKIDFPKIGYCQPGLMLCPDGICRLICTECPEGQTKCPDGLCKLTCAECPDNQIKCSDGICRENCCIPQCLGKSCGEDGCGGVCGFCSSEQTCDNGVCKSSPVNYWILIIVVLAIALIILFLIWLYRKSKRLR